MSGLLAGKPIIVIGMDDIGAGIAQRLAREGARLALLDHDPARAATIAAALTDTGATAHALPLDYRAAGVAVEDAATRLGGVYALVNNVLPKPVIATLEAQRPEAFAAAFERVQATVSAMQSVITHMRAAGEGKIVNIGHRYGENINEGLAAYNAAAWSLVGITRSAALDWGRFQIATNLLLPLADTTELRQAHVRRPKIIELMTSQLPLQRAGDCVEDIGGAVLFLVSDATNFVNGEVVHADGGQHVAGPLLDPQKFAD